MSHIDPRLPVTALRVLAAAVLAVSPLARGGEAPTPAPFGELRTVAIPAAAGLINYSFDAGLDLVYSGDDVTGPTGLASDGDLLGIEWHGPDQASDTVLLPYRASDGGRLDLKRAGDCFLLDGHVVALAGESLQTWTGNLLEAAAALGLDGLTDLRLLHLSPDLPLEARRIVAERALRNADVDAVMIEGGLTGCEDLLALLRPRLLVLEDESPAAALPRLRNVPLQSLFVSDPEDLDFSDLARLPELRSLVVMGSAEGTLRLPRSGAALERLVVRVQELEDIRHLDDLAALRQLILSPAPVSVLRQARRLPALDTLVLGSGAQEGKEADLRPLTGLTGLRTLGLRGRFAQADFDALLTANLGLRAVEVVDCEAITDLSTLRLLPQLQTLICIRSAPPDAELLGDLKHLQLLVLAGDHLSADQAEQVAGLAERLPQPCKVVPARGVCLGSGWLLLLLPLALTAAYLPGLRRRRVRVTLGVGE